MKRELKKSETGAFFDDMAEVEAYARAAFNDYVGFYIYQGAPLEHALKLAYNSIKDHMINEATQIQMLGVGR